MKRIFFYCISIFCIIILSSCHFKTVREFKFDETAFNEARQKWESNGLKDYSFTYVFDTYFPAIIKGESNVSSGTGAIVKFSVNLGGDFYEESEYDSFDENTKRAFTEMLDSFESRKMYSIRIKTIDEVFDIIDQQIKKRKLDYEANQDIELYSLRVSYDAEYGYPNDIYEYISYKSTPKGNGYISNYASDLDLEIRELK